MANPPPVTPEELYMSMANALFEAAGISCVPDTGMSQPGADGDQHPDSAPEKSATSDGDAAAGWQEREHQGGEYPSLLQVAPSDFYKESRWFYKAPLRPAMASCSSRVCCSGAPAAYKCHSCQKFDPLGLGLYCSECFVHAHPAHREDHRFAPLDETSCIQDDIIEQEYRAEAAENLEQLKALLSHVQRLGAKLGGGDGAGSAAGQQQAQLQDEENFKFNLKLIQEEANGQLALPPPNSDPASGEG